MAAAIEPSRRRASTLGAIGAPGSASRRLHGRPAARSAASTDAGSADVNARPRHRSIAVAASAPRTRMGAHTSTTASKASPAHQSPTRAHPSSTSARAGSASRVASTAWGTMSATRPPGATARHASTRNSAAESTYGVTTGPSRARSLASCAGRRAVSRPSWLWNGGFPTTRSNPVAGRSGQAAGPTARLSATTTWRASARTPPSAAHPSSVALVTATASGSMSVPQTRSATTVARSWPLASSRRAAASRKTPPPTAGSHTVGRRGGARSTPRAASPTRRSATEEGV